MTNIEKIKAALEFYADYDPDREEGAYGRYEIVSELDPFNEVFVHDEGNTAKEALALLDTPAPAQAEAMEALESLVDLCERKHTAKALAKRIRAALQSPARPVVKPLVWEYDENNKTWSAKTPFGTYQVSQWKWGFKTATSYYRGASFKAGEEEKGKAAAEAHWQQKIGEVLV